MRIITLALDDSHHSRLAVDWTMRHLFRRQTDALHLAYVLPPASPALPIDAGLPVIHAASMAAMQQQLESRLAKDEHDALHTLRKTVQTVHDDYKVPAENVRTHLLPAKGGASGVAESITELVKAQNSDLLVLGCRGLGAISRAAMSFIGLGSVSEYGLHNSQCATLVVRFKHGKEPNLCAEACPPPPTPAPKTVVVSTDGSVAGSNALSWALANVMLPADTLHIVCATSKSPMPVLDEPAAVAGLQAQVYADEQEALKQAATQVCESAVAAATKHGVLKSHVSGTVLEPRGTGSGDVGESISKFATEKSADVILLGCRGLGAVSRSVMGMLGLGSVSDYLVHNSQCPVLVVKAHGQELNETDIFSKVDEGSLLSRVDEESC